MDDGENRGLGVDCSEIGVGCPEMEMCWRITITGNSATVLGEYHSQYNKQMEFVIKIMDFSIVATMVVYVQVFVNKFLFSFHQESLHSLAPLLSLSFTHDGDKNPADEEITESKEQDGEQDHQGRDTEMTDTGSNLEPGAIIPNQVKEVERHHICSRQTQQEQREGRQVQGSTKDSEDGRNQEERNQDLEDQEDSHEKRVEHGRQPEHRLERERGQRGHITCTKEGHVDEEEEKDGGSCILGSQAACWVVDRHSRRGRALASCGRGAIGGGRRRGGSCQGSLLGSKSV